MQKIIEINEIYNPSWIYCDSGAGEYQIERLHIYGDEHPESGLKNKVIRRNFKQSLEIQDPITHEMDKKPLKQFMVTQLQIAFERDQLVLNPFDETLHKQLIDYEVIKYSGNTHEPIFTDKNEHFVDALGLAYLAFVIEFNELIDMVRDTSAKTFLSTTHASFAKKSVNTLFQKAESQRKQYSGENYSDPFNDEPYSKHLVATPIQEFTQQYSQSKWNGRKSTSGRNARSRW